MEKQDLSKILISDSEFYDRNAAYAHFLKRHNIVTVEELLNGTLEGNTFNGFKMKGVTISGLLNFIQILKHKYLGAPLLADVYMDRVIDLENTVLLSDRGHVRFSPIEGQDDEISIGKFICSDRGNYYFNKFARLKNLKRFHREHANLPATEEVKLIDFFKWILEENVNDFLVPFAKMYIESYEINKGLITQDALTIKKLKEQLTSLIEQKASLDSQIIKMQQKIESMSKKVEKFTEEKSSLDKQIGDIQQNIDELSNSNSEGGMKL